MVFVARIWCSWMLLRSNPRVMVYDDICTTGGQLATLGRYLVDEGAAAVYGLVLARTAWA